MMRESGRGWRQTLVSGLAAWGFVVVTAEAGRLVISDASIITMEEVGGQPEVLSGKTVIVNGDSITSIIESSTYEFVPGDEWIRAEGKWLMPALIHIEAKPQEPEDLIELLARGCVLARLPEIHQSFGERAGVEHWTEPHSPRLMHAYIKASVDEDRCARIFALADIEADAGGAAASAPKASGGASTPMVNAAQWGYLRAATVETAEAIHLGEKVGRIRPHFLADLVLLDESPLMREGPLRRIRGLVRRGEYIYRSAIDVALDHAAASRTAAAAYRAEALSTRHFADAAFRGTYVIRIDGLAIGVQHVEDAVREADGATLLQWSRATWRIPLGTTETEIAADPDGRVRSAEVKRSSPAQGFVVKLTREGEEVAATIEMKGEGAEDGDAAVKRTALATHEELSVDDLLTAFRMGRMTAAAEGRGGVENLYGQQLLFGDGPVGLHRFSIARRGGGDGPCLDRRSTRREVGMMASPAEANPTSHNLAVEIDAKSRPTRVEIRTPYGFILYERVAP